MNYKASRKSPVKTLVFAGAVLLAIAMIANFAVAQSDRGAITGTVNDPSGLAIAKAKVKITNIATGVQLVAQTDSKGSFTFPNLSVGVYNVTIDAQGFARFQEPDLRVDIGRTISVPAVLKVGSAQETVSVQATGEVLDTETSDVGDSVSTKHIMDLPLPLLGDMRNPVDFLTLTPGVSTATPGDNTGSECFQCSRRNFHFSGAPSASSEVYIDGIPDANPDFSGDVNTNHPSIEAVGEFRSINANPPAEYGLASGIASFTLRSGTNDFHGDVYDFLQNDHLDALDFVTKDLHGKKAPYKQNEFGFTLGGPVLLPKVYDGRGKTFFFVSYTGFRFRPSANTVDLTTFPTAFRTGDFSSLLGPQLTAPNPNDPSQMLPVYDPAGRPVLAGEIYDPTQTRTVTGPDGNSYVIRDPIPGNVIPQNYPGLSSAAQSILKYFPTATNNGLFNNYARNLSSQTNSDRTTVKIDQYFGTKQHLAASVNIGADVESNNGNLSLEEAAQSNNPSYQLRLSHNYTFSSNLINTASVGLLRDSFLAGPLQPSPPLSQLGLSGITYPADGGFPGINIQNLTGLGGATVSFAAHNRYIFNDIVDWQHGRHGLKFGAEIRKVQRNETPVTSGSYVFNAPQSGLNGTGFVNTSSGPVAVPIPNGTGSGAASFLFGAVSNSLYTTAANNEYYRWSVYSGFVQDDWKVNDSLTLNLGFRYDLPIPLTEKYGNVSNMDPTLPNPEAGGLPGAYTFYGTGPGRNGRARVGNIDYKGFQPRVGFAYSPRTDSGFMQRLLGNQQTVVRGGFSIIRPLGNENTRGGVGSNNLAAGFTGVAKTNEPSDQVGSPSFFLDQPYPTFVPPPFIDPTLLTGPVNPTWIPADAGMMPTQLNWSLEVQRSLSRSLVVSAGYVGMHIYHLGVWAKPNELNPALAASYAGVATADGLTLNQFLTLPITDPRAAAAGVNSPFANFTNLFGGGATVAQALRPFPQYGNIDGVDWPIASTHYNALQTRLQKNFSQGLSVLLAYTFSKTIGDADSAQIPTAAAQTGLFSSGFQQNFYNQKAEETITSSDIPQQVALSYTYELPFGPHKKFLNSGGTLGHIVGGWSVSGIQFYQSGRPLHIEYDQPGPANIYFAADGFSFTPDLVPGQPLVNPAFSKSCAGPLSGNAGRSSCQFYINPAAFSAQPVGQFGDAPRYMSGLREFPFYNEDISLIKRTKITERVDLEFQANAFNLLNRTVLGINGNALVYNQAPPNLGSGTLQTSTTPFGIPTYQQNQPRRIQFALKVEF